MEKGQLADSLVKGLPSEYSVAAGGSQVRRPMEKDGQEIRGLERREQDQPEAHKLTSLPWQVLPVRFPEGPVWVSYL